ncbi:hypothetical protein E6C76_18615 [Pseudothauera nasutitermitis]|uniref:Uncharacterized protein n=1 Tax=Pseudothauera nasutitermitis TaxID=2565930 RepID=A0A4S4ASF0_9RHOO|nr:hypothetical protein [Pseudothauera nasutitermitis]THF62334.1 hypothetical protein E6C76_18615 [Pseudothauera nasutitermitis]
MNRMHTFLAACALALLSGCSTTAPMNSSLTELGQSSSVVYGANGILVQRAIGINGLHAEDVPGSISRNLDQLPFWKRRWLASMNPLPDDLPDAMSPRLLPLSPTSRLSVRDYPSTGGDLSLAELHAVREQVLTLQESIAVLVQKKLEVLQLEQKGITTEALDTARTAAKDAETLVDGKQQRHLATLEKGGLVVANWARSVEASGKVQAADTTAAGLEAADKRHIEGYLIMANPRVLTLHFGQDLFKLLDALRARHQATDGSRLLDLDRLFITHFQIRAKRIAFAETRQQTSRAALNAKINELLGSVGAADQNTRQKILALQLELNARLESVTNTRNFGLLESMPPASQGNAGINQSIDLGTVSEGIQQPDTLPIVSFRVALGSLLGR